MRHHHGRQMVFRNDFLRQRQHIFRRFGVKGGGVLIQQEEFRLLDGRHQQRQCLPLSAGKQTYLAAHAVFQPQPQRRQLFAVLIAFLRRDAPAKRPALPAAIRQREVLLNVHRCRRAVHRVLEHAPQILRALVFRQVRHIHAINDDAAAIHHERTRDGVERRGFARAVAANHRDEITFRQMEVNIRQCALLGNQAGIEGLCNMIDIKHSASPPFERCGR